MFGSMPVLDGEGGAAASGGRPRPDLAPTVPAGAGIGYTPFLHDMLLRRREALDFVEVPLEPYLDEPRRALLDPGLARLDAVAAAHRCCWRGTALSLGSADPGRLDATEAAVVRLLARTAGATLCEDLAFRRVGGRDLGVPQTPRLDATLAGLAGSRCQALADRLPGPLVVGLPVAALAAADERAVRGFLARFAAASPCGLVLEIGDAAGTVDPAGLAARLAALPPGRIVQVAMASSADAGWALLDALLAATGARSVVVRRSRNLFPLDDVLSAVARAHDAIARARPTPREARSPAPAPVVASGDAQDAEGDLAALAREQAAFADRCLGDGEPSGAAAAVRIRAVWRGRVADIHLSKQLARWAARPATWRA